MRIKLASIVIILAILMGAAGAYAATRATPPLDQRYPHRYYVAVALNGAYGGYTTSVNYQVKGEATASLVFYVMEANGNVITSRTAAPLGFGSGSFYLGDGSVPPNFAGSALLVSTVPLAVVVHTSGPGGFGTYLVPDS